MVSEEFVSIFLVWGEEVVEVEGGDFLRPALEGDVIQVVDDRLQVVISRQRHLQRQRVKVKRRMMMIVRG